ncbi:hypothetical protein HA402_004242 [Bradysia odoriphaga]|nr:hypothetical protein HA402_004242 [Bradysia odoriphaga]
MCHQLSGGEMKRLSIALELVNNPPVIFLDEPTTGLDDLSCSQCISLLRRIALGGRTVVCSIHTPSAKIFEMFDLVYAMADGQCVYQGNGSHIVPYMKTVGLSCPVTHNPADFIVEVSCGEYGIEYIDRMVKAVENGKCYRWTPFLAVQNVLDEIEGGDGTIHEFEEDIDPKQLKCRSTSWDQFKVLFNRRWKQMWRDSCYMKLKIYMTLCLAVLVGCLYQGCGNDATKALFNFGFCFTVTIAFMYNPLMPVLLQFPSEIALIKREHFNRWFKLAPYYWALLLTRLPIQIGLCLIYLGITYPMSDQPLEWKRICMFFSITIMIALISESLGLLLASRLSLINGMFVGPVTTVPLMLLAVYGIGNDIEMPSYIKILMSFSYLRYGLEGLLDAMYGHDRADTLCPDTEIFCMFAKASYLKSLLGFNHSSYLVSIVALWLYYLLFTVAAYYMIKMRLSISASNYVAVQYIGRFVKTHLNFASYK